MSLNSSPLRVFSWRCGCVRVWCVCSNVRSQDKFHLHWLTPVVTSCTRSQTSFRAICPPQSKLSGSLMVSLCVALKCLGLDVTLGTTVGFLRLGGVCGCGFVGGRVGCPTSPSTFKHPAVNLSSWVYHQLLSYMLFSQLHLVSPAPSAFQSSWKHIFLIEAQS